MGDGVQAAVRVELLVDGGEGVTITVAVSDDPVLFSQVLGQVIAADRRAAKERRASNAERAITDTNNEVRDLRSIVTPLDPGALTNGTDTKGNP